jgi:hypothetical protein
MLKKASTITTLLYVQQIFSFSEHGGTSLFGACIQIETWGMGPFAGADYLHYLPQVARAGRGVAFPPLVYNRYFPFSEHGGTSMFLSLYSKRNVGYGLWD